MSEPYCRRYCFICGELIEDEDPFAEWDEGFGFYHRGCKEDEEREEP